MKKIGFLVISYHTVNFFRPIIKKLIARGHEVQIYAIDELPFGAKEDKFDTHRVDWHLFDFDPIYKFDPEVLVIFNGYFKSIHASAQFLKKKYNVLHAEVAWFPQRDHIYIDRDIHDKSDLADRVDGYCGALGSDKDRKAVTDNMDLLDKVRQKYVPSTNAPDEIIPDKVNIIVPLQLESDTSILYASDHFKTMESLVGFLDKCTRRYGKLINLIIKRHPKWDKDNFNKAFSKGTYENCTFIVDSHYSMNDYAYHCDAVMGINSTALMEAQLHYTPVLQFGNNIFDSNAYEPSYEVFENFVNKVREGYHNEESRLITDYKLLTMIINQVSFRDPEDWVIDKIERVKGFGWVRRLNDLG